MGDIIEFTTRAKSEIIFYKINSGAITFSIKGATNAIIGVAEQPNPSNAYWVYVGANGHAWIRKNQKNYAHVNIPELLSSTEYKDFWLAWNEKKIRFGRKNEPTPIIVSKVIKEKNLGYVTFTQHTNLPRIDLHWKILLPPEIEKPKVTDLKGNEPQWISATNQLPDDALIGGFENETLYIIRAIHSGALTPGKFVPSQGVGYIPWGGEDHIKNEFEVLCGYNCIWVKTSDDIIPVGAVEGGYSEDFQRSKLYVGRAECDGHLIPGKVQPTHKLCYLPYNGQEIARSNYEILVVPHTVTRSANSTYFTNFEMDGGQDFMESDSDHSED